MELFTPEIGLVIWMFVAFLILFGVLAKFGWPVIIKSVESRADLIDKGVEFARNAKEQLDNARQEAQKYISEAQKQQAEILRDASKLKSDIIEEAKREAANEAQKVMDAAKLSIDRQRKQAELQFRNEVSKFSIDIAEKMVRGTMSSDKAQKELVNKLLDEIEDSKN